MQIVYRKQGKYLRYSESTTHTGTHRRIEWVDELKDATVFAWRLHSLRDVAQDAEILEVEETRTVVLKEPAAEALEVYTGLPRTMTKELDDLRAMCEELDRALEGMLAIRSNSQGVAGYHLNGDIADWDYFDEVATAEAAHNKWKESK